MIKSRGGTDICHPQREGKDCEVPGTVCGHHRPGMEAAAREGFGMSPQTHAGQARGFMTEWNWMATFEGGLLPAEERALVDAAIGFREMDVPSRAPV